MLSGPIGTRNSLDDNDDITENYEKNFNYKDGDEDDENLFEAIIATVNRAGLLDFCSRLRLERKQDGRTTILAPPTIEDPLRGAHHVLLPIKFNDGVKWLAKIPGNGTESQFDELSCQALTAEALTMKFILQNTTIPIPRVLAYDASFDNDLGCPFILLSFVDGVPLSEIWFDESGTADPNARTNTLRDLATAMAQLSRFSFPSAGSLRFSPSGQPTSVGPLRCIDRKATMDNVFAEDTEVENKVVYFPAGPFSTTLSYLTLHLDREPLPSDPFQASLHHLLRRFLTWLSELEPSSSDHDFVLAHPDFDIQNILVDPEGRVRAIMDWDGVAAVPRCLGYGSFPGWLTRDWDPGIYAWKEGERGGDREDSPETLERHREEYAGCMREALKEERKGREGGDGGRVVEGRTEDSLYAENLFIASEDPGCRFGILEKFVGYIAGESGDEGLSGLDVFDVAEMITEGMLDGEIEAKLKDGFRGLFRQIGVSSMQGLGHV